MEGLSIFVLFIIISIIRRLLEQGKQQIPVPRQPEKGLPPLEPVPRKIPVKRKESAMDMKSDYEERLKETRFPGRIFTLEEEIEMPVSAKEEDIPVLTSFGISSDNLVGGVIMSEVLGPPRSKEPFRFRRFN